MMSIEKSIQPVSQMLTPQKMNKSECQVRKTKKCTAQVMCIKENK